MDAVREWAERHLLARAAVIGSEGPDPLPRALDRARVDAGREASFEHAAGVFVELGVLSEAGVAPLRWRLCEELARGSPGRRSPTTRGWRGALDARELAAQWRRLAELDGGRTPSMSVRRLPSPCRLTELLGVVAGAPSGAGAAARPCGRAVWRRRRGELAPAWGRSSRRRGFSRRTAPARQRAGAGRRRRRPSPRRG